MNPNEVAAAMGLRIVGGTRHGQSASTLEVRTADGVDAVLKVHEVGSVDGGDAGAAMKHLAGHAFLDDLVTHALYTYDFGVRDELLAMTRGLTPPRALALYAAHMVLRQVDWSLRHQTEIEVEWFMGVGEAQPRGSTAQIRRPGRLG